MMEKNKSVLVCLGERKRGVSFSCGKDSEEERAAIIEAVKEAYKDVSKFDGDLVLQIKSELWEGEFLDLATGEVIPNKAVLRAILEVSPSIYYYNCGRANFLLCCHITKSSYLYCEAIKPG